MKKVLSLLLAFSLIFCLCACDSTSSSKGADNVPAKGYFELNEAAKIDNLQITATELKISKGDDIWKPAEGNVFVGVNFTIENTSTENKTVSSALSFDAYVDGVKCDYSISAACAFDEGTLDGELAAGKKLIGWYALELKSDWKELEIQFTPNIIADDCATFKFTNK